MTPTAAAKQWLAAKAEERAAKARVDEAAEVLKEMFRSTGKASFRGVGYSQSTYVQLDAAKARQLLGKRAAEAEVTRIRETLSAVAA